MLQLSAKSKIIEYSLYIACILSNLSQLPYFVTNGITQQVVFPGWILLFVVLLIKQQIKLKSSLFPYFGISLMIVIWLLFDGILIQEDLFSSPTVYSYAISFFIFCLGSWSTNYIDQPTFKNIEKFFLISLIVVTGVIFIEYFGVGYDLNTRIYAYSSKNSISQLILIVIIMLLLRFQSAKLFSRILLVSVMAFELYTLLLLRSRATLLGLAVCLLVLLFIKSTNRRLKNAIIFSGILFIVYTFLNDQFYNFVFNNVFFANRSATDLNELSSGRVTILRSFPTLLAERWLTGIGATYFECFPLSVVLQFGIIGGALFILFSLTPLYTSFMRKNDSEEWLLLFLIAIAFSINGLFEGLTPLGPGVKCYFMWLLYGMLLSKKTLNGYKN